MMVFGLAVAQALLPGLVQRGVGAVVVEQVELDAVRSGRARKYRSMFQLSGEILAGSGWPVV